MCGYKPSLFWIFATLYCSLYCYGAMASSDQIDSKDPAPSIHAENLNPGPRSPEEAKFLFKEARDAIEKKNLKLAKRDLVRFIDRYSSDEKANEAYLSLIETLFAEREHEEVIRYGRELLNRKTEPAMANRAKQWMAESFLNLKDFVEARVILDELLKANPTAKQKATAYSIKFQCFLEEKHFEEAGSELDALTSLLQKEPMDTFLKVIPEYKMTLEIRKCEISHLLKNKQFTGIDPDEETGHQFTEEELTEYFSKKNLCLKSALPNTLTITNQDVIHEWCESFTHFHHELERLNTDPFLKTKIAKELQATFDFSKTLSPDLSKCYEPIKIKKRHRKRRVHPSRTGSSVVQPKI